MGRPPSCNRCCDDDCECGNLNNNEDGCVSVSISENNEASRNVSVECCPENLLPDKLDIVFTPTGDETECGCTGETPYLLEWNGASWSGEVEVCSKQLTAILTCCDGGDSETDFILALFASSNQAGNCGAAVGKCASSGDCDPFTLSFDDLCLGDGQCCSQCECNPDVAYCGSGMHSFNIMFTPSAGAGTLTSPCCFGAEFPDSFDITLIRNDSTSCACADNLSGTLTRTLPSAFWVGTIDLGGNCTGPVEPFGSPVDFPEGAIGIQMICCFDRNKTPRFIFTIPGALSYVCNNPLIPENHPRQDCTKNPFNKSFSLCWDLDDECSTGSMSGTVGPFCYPICRSCCPYVHLPDTLVCTVSGTIHCACFSGVAVLTKVAGEQQWKGSIPGDPCENTPGGCQRFDVVLSCGGDDTDPSDLSWIDPARRFGLSIHAIRNPPPAGNFCCKGIVTTLGAANDATCFPTNLEFHDPMAPRSFERGMCDCDAIIPVPPFPELFATVTQ